MIKKHSHDHRAKSQKPKSLLVLAFVLTALTFLLEAVTAWWTNSLALMSDAGHVLTDLLALFLSLMALRLSERPPSSRNTYGLHRLEVFAAFANGLLVSAVAVWITVESIQRFQAPRDIKTGPLLIVALIGLVVNLAIAWRLHGFSKGDVNVRGAFIHVLSDALASVGVVVGALVIRFTGLLWVDPAVGLIIAALIIVNALRLLKESIDILLEGTPKNVQLDDVIEALRKIKGVLRVEDPHAWNICSHMGSFSAHVTVATDQMGRQREILEESHALLRERFHIEHVTIQIHSEEWPVSSPHDAAPA